MVALSVNATDTPGNMLRYGVTGLPSGLSYNPTTGMIFGTISSSAHAGSPYSVTYTANRFGKQ